MGFLQNLFDPSKKEVKKLSKVADQIVALEDEYKALSDDDLKHKTVEFKERYANGETLDDLLVEAFATVREAAARTVNMRHFPVQLIGGMVLHNGDIAEMRTGEGKTLVATLPAYLNALSGEGVYIVTVNDYLARRDSEWMGKIYKFLGMSVGLVIPDLSYEEKQAAYRSDIIYGTNNEFGFDYLRDNMVTSKEEQVQRGLHYAIIDEVDSVLIDEARTPLIISGSGDESTDLYRTADIFAKSLKDDDYEKDEKEKAVTLTEKGTAKAEKFFGIKNLADVENMEIMHNINQALYANTLMTKDVDYIVKNDEIIIIDEFTGRQMPGRRYSNGLHQAIEAKEHVTVNRESRTMATITFQNYFRMFDKLAGMTGTAKTEEEEFNTIYNLNVVTIPTNKPMIRQDLNDLVYRTEKAKFKAVTEDVKRRHAKGQPVLVGTISVETSEMLSQMLRREGIVHEVLNAKFHEREAQIVAQAGQVGAVTVATNMAGRGTDIKLGEGVAELGGLKIIGTERHESRRIDNQLRGRAGRQGDPGSTQFFLSLEDDLMRIFGSDRIKSVVENLGMDDETPLDAKMLNRSIESAQKKVEARNFDIRKNVLQYDNVMNRQREIIYAQRQEVLDGKNMHEQIDKMTKDLINDYVDMYTNAGDSLEDWDVKKLKRYFGEFLPVDRLKLEEGVTVQDIKDQLYALCRENYQSKVALIGEDEMENMERVVLLRAVDAAWMVHIDDMEQLKEGIGLRAYGQNDPVVAYTDEGFKMFEDMNAEIQEETVKYIYNMKIKLVPPKQRQRRAQMHTNEAQITGQGGDEPVQKTIHKKKIGRNDPCPCGSGKKYKNCHGRYAN